MPAPQHIRPGPDPAASPRARLPRGKAAPAQPGSLAAAPLSLSRLLLHPALPIHGLSPVLRGGDAAQYHFLRGICLDLLECGVLPLVRRRTGETPDQYLARIWHQYAYQRGLTVRSQEHWEHEYCGYQGHVQGQLDGPVLSITQPRMTHILSADDLSPLGIGGELRAALLYWLEHLSHPALPVLGPHGARSLAEQYYWRGSKDAWLQDTLYEWAEYTGLSERTTARLMRSPQQLTPKQQEAFDEYLAENGLISPADFDVLYGDELPLYTNAAHECGPYRLDALAQHPNPHVSAAAARLLNIRDLNAQVQQLLTPLGDAYLTPKLYSIPDYAYLIELDSGPSDERGLVDTGLLYDLADNVMRDIFEQGESLKNTVDLTLTEDTRGCAGTLTELLWHARTEIDAVVEGLFGECISRYRASQKA